MRTQAGAWERQSQRLRSLLQLVAGTADQNVDALFALQVVLVMVVGDSFPNI